MNLDTKVKICGITRAEDATAAAAAGADYLGLIIECPASPRSLTTEQARRVGASVSLPVIAVTVNLPIEKLLEIIEALSPWGLQLHGNEPAEQVAELRQKADCEIWKTLHFEAQTLISADELNCHLRRAEEYLAAGVECILLDAASGTGRQRQLGGTGQTVHWQRAAEFVNAVRCPVILAGGLNPANVGEAVRVVRPFAVDVSSGVEARPGRKDSAKVQSFIQRVREEEPA